MNENIPITPIEEVEAEFKTTLAPEQTAAALAELYNKPFSQRHAELGKMVKCPVHGFRHRKFEFKPKTGCEQVFTYKVKDKDGKLYEQFREETNEETGETKLVPDFRTAIPVNARPTMKQFVGAASVAKKRFHPHPSKIKLQFIERTRKVFLELGFQLEPTEDEDKTKFNEQFQKDLQRARVVAARQIRKERKLRDRSYRRRRDQARRINAGLRSGRNLA